MISVVQDGLDHSGVLIVDVLIVVNVAIRLLAVVKCATKLTWFQCGAVTIICGVLMVVLVVKGGFGVDHVAALS